MNQPPMDPPDSRSAVTRSAATRSAASRSANSRSVTRWRRPRGVAAGTWDYINERSIADHYDAFVADTPLCRLDAELLRRLFPGVQKVRDVSLAAADAVRECETILDLGCGSGRTSVDLADRGYYVVGVDLSLHMLEILLRKSSESSGPRELHPVRANLVELDGFADCCADHAICLFSTLGMVQGHQNRLAMLRHVARIVRPGGKLVLHVHNRWTALREQRGLRLLARSWWQSLRDPAMQWGDAVYPYRGVEKMFLHRFSKREILRDLRRSGWTIRELHRVSIDGEKVDRSLRIPGGFIVVSERKP